MNSVPEGEIHIQLDRSKETDVVVSGLLCLWIAARMQDKS